MKKKLKTKQKNKIEKGIKLLNEAIKEMRDYMDDPNYYISDTGNFHVMDGQSHEGNKGTARQDRVLHYEYLDTASGGDW